MLRMQTDVQELLRWGLFVALLATAAGCGKSKAATPVEQGPVEQVRADQGIQNHGCPNDTRNCPTAFMSTDVYDGATLTDDQLKEKLFADRSWAAPNAGDLYGFVPRASRCQSGQCRSVKQRLRVARTAIDAKLPDLSGRVAYAIARIDVDENAQLPDSIYRLHTENGKLMKSFFFFAKKYSGSSAPPDQPVAVLEVYGIRADSANRGQLKKIGTSERYIRRCGMPEDEHGDATSKAYFKGCDLGHRAMDAATSLGLSLEDAVAQLTADPVIAINAPNRERVHWNTLLEFAHDDPIGLAWFTCEKGCCTADALLQ